MRFKYISEDLYTYVISDYTNIPPKELYIFASKNPIKSYQTVEQDLYHIKYCLFFYKQPIIIGVQVYDNFQNLDKNYVCPIPDPSKNQLLGGHALTLIAWNDDLKSFLIVNSWGKSYALNGCFYMPYEYVLNPNLCSDIWTISLGN